MSRSRAVATPAVLALAALMLGTMPAAPASSDDQSKRSTNAWRAADQCARSAVRAFPDYTPESLAKREAFRRDCLRKANLPVGDDPPPAPR